MLKQSQVIYFKLKNSAVYHCTVWSRSYLDHMVFLFLNVSMPNSTLFTAVYVCCTVVPCCRPISPPPVEHKVTQATTGKSEGVDSPNSTAHL